MAKKRLSWAFALFMLLFLLPAFFLLQGHDALAQDEFCSIGNSSSCDVNEGRLTLDPIETSAFLSSARDEVCIVYFYSETCSHCKSIKPFIDQMEHKYEGKVHLTRYDVGYPENINLYNRLCNLRGYDGKSIPLVGINDVILVGESQIRSRLESEISRGIESDDKLCPLGGMECHAGNESAATAEDDNLIPGLRDLEWSSVMPIIIVSGLGDGVNPCAFVILIFVMVFLQQISGSRKRLLKVTLTYIISLLATNILLGVLYFLFSIHIGYPTAIRYAVIGISFAAGAINIKDFFYYGKGISLGIPKAAKGYLKGLINRASVPSSFMLGVSVGLLEAPCSVPIYLAVIEVLKGEGNTLGQVMPYILLYNLMFILPLLALSVAVYLGKSANYFERQSLKSKRWMKLALGIILLLLGLVLLFGIL